MKAVIIHATGDADVLRLEEVERPEPGEDEVLIRVQAAAVNPVDWKYRRGLVQRELPAVLGRATRRSREPPSDAQIERGLRERAVTDPRAAEILLRWLQRARAPEATPGVDLDAMSERELEWLPAGLVKLATMDEPVLAALVEHVAGDELVSSS